MTVAKAGPSTSTQHWARIGQARTFIRAHAAEPLTVERIAEEAAISPFHFARLFRALTGETIYRHVTRVRLRMAVERLVDRPEMSVSDVAAAVGYDAPSSFNKLFRKTFGTSPTRFRALPAVARTSLLARLEDLDMGVHGGLDISTHPEFREREDRRFLFVRRRGVCPEEAPQAWADFHRLVSAARLPRADVEFLGASYDDAGKVAEQPHCYEAGVTVPEGVPVPKGLASGTLRGGRYAVFRYHGAYAHIGRAFDTLFSGWVVVSGATLRSAPCLEIYLNDSRTAPQDELLTELCIPVEDWR